MKKRWMTLVLVLVICLSALNAPVASADLWSYSAETTLFGSTPNKLNNLALAIEKLDGTFVLYGETFSFNDVIGPRGKEEGYLSARNGRGARVLGGGVSQLATTLYLAARDCEYLSFEEFASYDDRFTDWYVENGEEAIITDYQTDKDFEFTNWYDGVLYISAWMDEENVYCCVELLDEVPGGYENMIARSSTPLFGSDNKIHNIELTSSMIDGTAFEFGGVFSFNEIVGPRSKEAGFYNAENGRGVKVRGGGVAQVASTIYMAVKELNCVVVEPVRTYGEKFVDGYVTDVEDAVVTDYNAGYDLAFTYWGDGLLTISLYSDGEELICEVYEE